MPADVCVRGHRISEVGRSIYGTCHACRREDQRRVQAAKYLAFLYVPGLQSAREGAGHTQTSLAEAYGTSQGHISRLEGCRERSRRGTRERLAELLNVEVRDLVGEEDRPLLPDG